MAERRNILQQFSDRFAAKEKERKARQADIQRRAAKATRAATSNVKDVVRGAAKLPVTAFDYLRTSKPMDVARDVGRFAVGIGEDIAADPAGFVAEELAAPLVAARDFAVTREKAAEARAAGDTETANKLEQLAALAVVGGAPIIGKGARKAVKAGTKKAVKGAKVTEKTFEKMSQSGKLRTDAHNDKTNIKLVLKGDKPATDIEIDFDDPKGDALAQRLTKQGLVLTEHPTDTRRAIVAKSTADAERLAKAETNYAMGKAYGYSDEDIARFYKERFGPEAFREWSLDKDDWSKNFDAEAAVKKVAPKPLTEKQFERQYLQHIDLRSRDKETAEQVREKIMNEGFKPGFGLNLLPVWRGGEPQNIVTKGYLPEAGDKVYLVPRTGRDDKRQQITKGWRPEPYEALTLEQTGEDLYPLYRRAFEEYAAKNAATPEAQRFAVPATAKQETRDFSAMDLDPEFYGLRKTKDFPRLREAPARFEVTKDISNPDEVSLESLIGRPFISTMSDRTAAGSRLVGVGDTDLNVPVDLQGGQDFMLAPTKEGLVWASAPGAVSNIMNTARYLKATTGQNPVYLPFRMAGQSSDFATMTGEAMMSYADAALGKSDKTALNRLIETYIPDFKGINSPEGYMQFANLTGKQRINLQNEMGAMFGEEGGGLTVPMTRALIADPTQINAPSYFLQNVGEINPELEAVINTGHRTYERGVPGRGLGRLKEQVNVAELLPELSARYGIGNPREFKGQYAPFTEYGRKIKVAEDAEARAAAERKGKDYRSRNTEKGGTTKYMQSGAKFGILDEDLVRRILEGNY